jgi:hypothetical protein
MVQENTYSVIEAIVSSRMVFHRYNLNALTALLVRAGPALDAMSDSGGPSRRLPNLLNVLKANPKSRTPEQQEDIDGLCEVLGRRTSSCEEIIAGDGLEEEEEIATILCRFDLVISIRTIAWLLEPSYNIASLQGRKVASLPSTQFENHTGLPHLKSSMNFN